MENCFIKGSNSNKIEFNLAIPKAKHFQIQAVFKGERQLQVKHIINDAVKSKHKPYGSCTYGHIKSMHSYLFNKTHAVIQTI